MLVHRFYRKFITLSYSNLLNLFGYFIGGIYICVPTAHTHKNKIIPVKQQQKNTVFELLDRPTRCYVMTFVVRRYAYLMTQGINAFDSLSRTAPKCVHVNDIDKGDNVDSRQ